MPNPSLARACQHWSRRVAALLHPLLRTIEPFDPDPPQGLYGWHFAQPYGGRECLQQSITIGGDDRRQLPPRLGFLGETGLIDPWSVAVNPLPGRCVPAASPGRPHSEAIQGRAHRLADAFEAIDGADSRKHPAPRVPGRVGALLAPRIEQLCARKCSSSRSSIRCSSPPETRRVRDSESTEESKPGSSNASDKRYFQSMRARTVSAACRSERPSTYCITQTSARRQGETTGRPRAGNKGANASSVKRVPILSRMRIQGLLRRNAARAMRAVCSGMGATACGCSDMMPPSVSFAGECLAASYTERGDGGKIPRLPIVSDLPAVSGFGDEILSAQSRKIPLMRRPVGMPRNDGG